MEGSVLQVEVFSDAQGPHFRTAELDLDKCLATNSWGKHTLYPVFPNWRQRELTGSVSSFR
jgi:hypothetical protein